MTKPEELVNEIDAMLDGKSAAPAEPAVPVEPPTVEPPVEEPVAVEPPAEPAEPPVDPAVDPEAEPPVEPEPGAPVFNRDAYNEQINSLASKVTEPAATAAPPAQAPPAEDVMFQLDDDAFNSSMTSADAFNANVLNKINDHVKSVVQKATELAVQSAMQGSMSQNVKTVQDIVDVRFGASDFFAQNEDLSELKPFVASVANEIFAANPTISISDGFKKTGEEVRKRLKLGNPVGETQKQTKVQRTPGIISKSTQSSRSKTPQVPTGMNAEIDAMLALDER